MPIGCSRQNNDEYCGTPKNIRSVRAVGAASHGLTSRSITFAHGPGVVQRDLRTRKSCIGDVTVARVQERSCDKGYRSETLWKSRGGRSLKTIALLGQCQEPANACLSGWKIWMHGKRC